MTAVPRRRGELGGSSANSTVTAPTGNDTPANPMENMFLCFTECEVTYSAIAGGTARYYISSDEPCAEQFLTELVPGSISGCGELDTATVDHVKGIPMVAATSGGWMAHALAPVHNHPNICRAAFACER